MILVKLDALEFENEIFDILRLFFKEEEVIRGDTGDEPETADLRLFGRLRPDRALYSLEFFYGNTHTVSEIALPVPISGQRKHESKREFKWAVKRRVYSELSKYTGRDMPWGMLTGIRPAKIVHEMMEKGKDKEEILKTLKEYHFISGQKSELLYQVADTEKKILNTSAPDMAGLYIGIPFCPTRCLYCSFTSNPIHQRTSIVGKYLEALKREMAEAAALIREKGYRLQSIYIGGGTPTSIDAVSLEGLLECVESVFDLESLEEYTLEAGRPDSLDRDKLHVIRKSKVDRISINPQSMNDATLRLIGRNHTAEDIVNAFCMAREIGFGNINMDVIVGLPGEDVPMFENTMQKICALGPESLTVHTMAIKRASKLNEERDKFDLSGGNSAETMVETARRYADEMGMHPYYLYRQKNILGNLENVGYCKPGFESVYNVQIMEEKQTIIALGAGGITKRVYPEENRIERAFNVKNVEEYITRIDEMVERKRQLL